MQKSDDWRQIIPRDKLDKPKGKLEKLRAFESSMLEKHGPAGSRVGLLPLSIRTYRRMSAEEIEVWRDLRHRALPTKHSN